MESSESYRWRCRRWSKRR